MTRILLVVAVGSAALASSGCAGNRQMLAARNCCGPQCHIARSQSAPRPQICRDGCHPGSCPLNGIMQCSCCADACGECDSCQSCSSCNARVFGRNCGPCDTCGSRGGCGCRAAKCMVNCVLGPPGYEDDYVTSHGPPVGQVAYPYYSVRGPRDFLRNNPPPIGP